MQGSTSVLKMLNENMEVNQIREVMKEFNKQTGKAEMNQDMINDAMEMGMDNVDEQADDVYNGILGEIGLDYEVNAGKVGSGKIAGPAQQQQEEQKAGGMDDLEARLAALNS